MADKTGASVIRFLPFRHLGRAGIAAVPRSTKLCTKPRKSTPRH